MSAWIHTHSFTVQWKHIQYSGNRFILCLTPANQVIVQKKGKNFKLWLFNTCALCVHQCSALSFVPGRGLLLLCVWTAGLRQQQRRHPKSWPLYTFNHAEELARGCHLLKAVGEEIKRGGSILSCHCQEDERMGLWWRITHQCWRNPFWPRLALFLRVLK